MSLFGFLRRLLSGGSDPEPGRARGTARERTRGGSEVLRHRERTRPVDLVPPAGEDAEAIEKHVQTHVGPVESVFHEIVSDLVHLDVLLVAPRPERRYWTLVTSGMSDLPMTVPEGLEAFRHAELMLCLPPTWPLTGEASKDDRNDWPLRWLKQLARLPHEYDTWLGDGHTVPNGDPAEPLHEGTRLTGWLLTLPRRFGPDFLTLRISREKTVHFYAAFPLHTDEMGLKLECGAEYLNGRLDEAGVTELLDPARASVA